ncbi:MAG: hypothetical protein K0R29_2805 [Pseudobdellovibrio sp.]|nr:hypothetical protein [Pseudobdellovibrio sp.]
MKLLVSLALILGSLSAFAVETPNAVECSIMHGQASPNPHVNGITLLHFTRDDMSRGSKPAGEYEGVKLSLEIKLPSSEQTDPAQVLLHEESATNTAITTLSGTYMEEQRAVFSYRKPGSSHILFVVCEAK